MKNIFKKFFVFTSVLGAVAFCVAALSPANTYAADRKPCGGFLGFNSWDCGITDINAISSEDDLKQSAIIIAANIAVDISIAAAYLVLGFVIYGGYQYTFSGGDPGKVANGKKTLLHAFIGLGVVMLASVILNTIRIALAADFTGKCTALDANCGVDPNAMVTSMIQWTIGVAGVAAAVFLVYGGISYATSTGDPGKVKKAKDMILYALIGLVIVALAEIITAFVSNMIKDANTTSLIQIEEQYEPTKIS